MGLSTDAKAKVSTFTDGGLLRDSAQALYIDFFSQSKKSASYALLSYPTKRNTFGYNMLPWFCLKITITHTAWILTHFNIVGKFVP